MSRTVKEMMVERYASRLRDVSDLAVVSTAGIDVVRLVLLRQSLRRRGIRAMVVKNRLCRRALETVGLEAAVLLLRGPSTLVWGGEGIVDIAKALAEETKTYSELAIRGGLSEGRVLSGDQIGALAKMPSREELLGQVVGRVIGQVARVVALAVAPVQRVLAQIREVGGRAPQMPEGTEAVKPAETERQEEPKAEAPAEGREAETASPAPGEPRAGNESDSREEPSPPDKGRASEA